MQCMRPGISHIVFPCVPVDRPSSIFLNFVVSVSSSSPLLLHVSSRFSHLFWSSCVLFQSEPSSSSSFFEAISCTFEILVSSAVSIVSSIRCCYCCVFAPFSLSIFLFFLYPPFSDSRQFRARIFFRESGSIRAGVFKIKNFEYARDLLDQNVHLSFFHISIRNRREFGWVNELKMTKEKSNKKQYDTKMPRW